MNPSIVEITAFAFGDDPTAGAAIIAVAGMAFLLVLRVVQVLSMRKCAIVIKVDG